MQIEWKFKAFLREASSSSLMEIFRSGLISISASKSSYSSSTSSREVCRTGFNGRDKDLFGRWAAGNSAALLHLQDTVAWVLENSSRIVRIFQGIFQVGDKLTYSRRTPGATGGPLPFSAR